MNKNPKITYMEDYKVPSYLIPKIDLHFNLKEEESIVTSNMIFTRNRESDSKSKNLFLDGNNLNLLEIKRNGQVMNPDNYQLNPQGLLLKNCPDQFEIQTKVCLKPQDNKAFSGLYKTRTVFCTQMEAQGFRKTTFFMDRPDILSRYKTILIADKNQHPVLLSNGNLIFKEDLKNGQHRTLWEDPFPKPCYLFALVAGDLDWIEDSFKTLSGRSVILKIFVNKGQKKRAYHAMDSLKQAMKWDEETFHLEYDLDIYNIVAVDDFNMGAMENKSLNIFNSKCTLASPETTTDDELLTIQRVVGHEYFHNWSGNRVTCRDWFQLSLKEGLTVFRDQEFSSDRNSRTVKRIEDVMKLRTHQFPEDSGPMAHPVRPSSYIAIDNFYTVTVYEKGAEVIRMLQSLLGIDLFKKGVSRYFELFDGQAVTTDDWVSAMEQVSGRDLRQFKLWYDQAGTPKVSVQTQYFRETKSYEIKLKQKIKNPLTEKPQKPFHIPLKIGLLSRKGEPLKFMQQNICSESLLELTQREQTFVLTQVEEEPILSINRGFSAPIHLKYEQSNEDLIFLMKKDRDSFNRWNSAQKIYHKQLIKNYNDLLEAKKPQLSPLIPQVILSLISDKDKDPALLAKTLEWPQVQYLSQSLSEIEPQFLKKAYEHFYKEFSKELHDPLIKEYKKLQTKPLGQSSKDMGLRSYKNKLLNLLYRHDEKKGAELFYEHFKKADNMTDSLAALYRLGSHGGEFYDKAMEEFYNQWYKDSLVMNKWLTVTALSQSKNCFEKIKEKTLSPVFNKTNPNNIFALLYQFAHFNWACFHSKTGETYDWFSDQIMDVDSRNPQVASRLGSCFNNWKKFHEDYQKPIKSALEKILNNSPTNNLFEVINRALKGRS